MKKNNFFVLIAASLLSLGACTGNNNNKESSKNEPASNPGGESSIPVDGGDEIKLTDLVEPTTEIDFDDVEDTCMINPKAKIYIDAMEEQEKTLDKPYHFSSLYGPDDYAKIAAAADKGDGTTYADADKGGVDVCELLNRNDYGNDCKNYPIKLTWEDDGLDYEGAVVKFWSKEDFSDVREAPIVVDQTNYIVSAELPNLFRATKYRVQVVTADEDASQGFEFTTGDYPRTITMGGVHNVRDIGGFMTSYGVRTNQGLMYRGYYIDDKSGGHGVNYSEEVQKVQEEVMKIGYEIDLQKESETNGRTASALNSDVTPCDYICRTLVSYENFLKQDSYKNLPEVMHIMANSDKQHTYFHCWGGADRTGMLDFFINAILGVSYTDLIEEFELTTQTNNKRCHMHNSSSAHYPKFMDAFINGYTDNGKTWDGFDPEATVNENCEKWMIEYAGVAEEDIERIREIMLPGYEDGKITQDDAKKMIPTYTPDGEWVSDDLAHWKVAKEDANVKCNWHRHDGAVCSICGHGGQGGGGQQGGEETTDFSRPIGGRVWTESAPQNNSDGKPYIQLNDASTGKKGVKIKFADYGPASTATINGGKIDPQNDTSVFLSYKIKAPKAGAYQLVMNGRVSQSGLGKTLSERSFKVTLNGATVDIENTVTDILTADGDNDFVCAPTINLTGNEDTVTIACPNYRIIFTDGSYLTFIEH